MALPESAYYIGIDWGSAEHAVCVLNESGRVKSEASTATAVWEDLCGSIPIQITGSRPCAR